MGPCGALGGLAAGGAVGAGPPLRPRTQHRGGRLAGQHGRRRPGGGPWASPVRPPAVPVDGPVCAGARPRYRDCGVGAPALWLCKNWCWWCFRCSLCSAESARGGLLSAFSSQRRAAWAPLWTQVMSHAASLPGGSVPCVEARSHPSQAGSDAQCADGRVALWTRGAGVPVGLGPRPTAGAEGSPSHLVGAPHVAGRRPGKREVSEV